MDHPVGILFEEVPMSNGVKLDIDNFLLGDHARFLLLSQDGARGKKSVALQCANLSSICPQGIVPF